MEIQVTKPIFLLCISFVKFFSSFFFFYDQVCAHLCPSGRKLMQDFENFRPFEYLFSFFVRLPSVYSQNFNYLYIQHNIFHHHRCLF